MKKILGALLITTIFLISLVWADTNGIWHNTEDIKPGIFAVDEGYGNFVFEDLTANEIQVDIVESSGTLSISFN